MNILRKPSTIDQLRTADGGYLADPQCTAIYRVTLDTKYATQSELGDTPGDIGGSPRSRPSCLPTTIFRSACCECFEFLQSTGRGRTAYYFTGYARNTGI